VPQHRGHHEAPRDRGQVMVSRHYAKAFISFYNQIPLLVRNYKTL
jgi:hypothetical protein